MFRGLLFAEFTYQRLVSDRCPKVYRCKEMSPQTLLVFCSSCNREFQFRPSTDISTEFKCPACNAIIDVGLNTWLCAIPASNESDIPQTRSTFDQATKSKSPIERPIEHAVNEGLHPAKEPDEI